MENAWLDVTLHNPGPHIALMAASPTAPTAFQRTCCFCLLHVDNYVSLVPGENQVHHHRGGEIWTSRVNCRWLYWMGGNMSGSPPGHRVMRRSR